MPAEGSGPDLRGSTLHTATKSAVKIVCTFFLILLVSLLSLKTSKEFELLRRSLMSIGKATQCLLDKIGFKQEDPLDLIN